MFDYLKKVYYVYAKDMKDEFRGFDNLVSTIIFGLMLIFIFSLAFQLADLEVDRTLPAVMWVIIFFASTLGLQRSFAREEENQAIDALLLAAGDRSTIFLAKSFCNLTTLLVFEVTAVPLLWLFTGASRPAHIGLLLLTVLMGSWGLALVGTLLNGITIQLPTARLLFPILLFPLLVPVLVAVMHLTSAALDTAEFSIRWLYLLVSYDLLFVISPLVLSDYILEG